MVDCGRHQQSGQTPKRVLQSTKKMAIVEMMNVGTYVQFNNSRILLSFFVVGTIRRSSSKGCGPPSQRVYRLLHCKESLIDKLDIVRRFAQHFLDRPIDPRFSSPRFSN
jgi:hypothetical protein